MYMRYIQFRILHYRIATWSELYKMKIVTDDSCEYCKQKESIKHLFHECEKSSLLWIEVQEWIKRMGFGNYNLEIRSIILDESRKKYKLINIILLATKNDRILEPQQILQIVIGASQVCDERSLPHRKVLGRKQ